MSCQPLAHRHTGHLLVGMATSEPLGWAKGHLFSRQRGWTGLPLATGFWAGLGICIHIHTLDKWGGFSQCDLEMICPDTGPSLCNTSSTYLHTYLLMVPPQPKIRSKILFFFAHFIINLILLPLQYGIYHPANSIFFYCNYSNTNLMKRLVGCEHFSHEQIEDIL